MTPVGGMFSPGPFLHVNKAPFKSFMYLPPGSPGILPDILPGAGDFTINFPCPRGVAIFPKCFGLFFDFYHINDSK